MPPGLSQLAQDVFSAGAVRSVARNLIPSSGLFDLENGLLDEDGAIYKRGGSVFVSNAAFGTSLRWLWAGQFAAGSRVVFASPTAYGVLAADGVTPVSLGGSGLLEPVSVAQIGELLFIGGGRIYAGSQKAAAYSTGTVAVTLGSASVVGTGTAWLANVDAGMLLRVGSGTRYYVVKSVNSDTSITLTEAFHEATASGQAYSLSRLGSTATATGYATAPIYAAVGGRLWALSGNQIRFSDGVSATTFGLQPHSFPANNLHELPGAAQIVAAGVVRDRLMVFTTAGLWMVSNTALNIVDATGNPQQRLEQVSDDLVGWGQSGVVAWQNALVVPSTNGVYLLDGISAPVLVSRSIAPVIAGYVRQGFKPGQAAVFRSHLFLPVLDTSNVVVDLLVCRLDRPVDTPQGRMWPWSRLSGHGGNAAALSVQNQAGASRLPKLLGAGPEGRVLGLSSLFDPSATVKADADGTVPRFLLETRDYSAGTRNRSLWRRVRLRYELYDAASDHPLLTLYTSVGTQQQAVGKWGDAWDAMLWSGADTIEFVQAQTGAPPDDGRRPYAWEVGREAEFLRYRLISSDPVAKLVVRSITSELRLSGKVF